MKKIIFSLLAVLTFIFTEQLSSQTLWELRPDYDTENDPFFDPLDTIPADELGDWGVVESVHTLTGEESSLTVELPSGSIMSFEAEYSVKDTFNVITWFGRNIDSLSYPNSVAHFSIHNDSLLGYVKLNDSIAYEILPMHGNFYVSFDTKFDKSCDTDLMPNYKDTNLVMSRLKGSPPIQSCGGLNIFRMIIAYTPQFAATFNLIDRQKKINDFLVGVVDSINNTYIYSNTNIRVRLALSYQTDHEIGNKDFDLPAFSYKDDNFNIIGVPHGRYDEIFDLRVQYRADAAFLLVRYVDPNTSSGSGGRANRKQQTAVYSKTGVAESYGAAHELGHIFDLEHDRGNFSNFVGFFKKTFGGLDKKKAYGHWGNNYGTVMGRLRSPEQRVRLYSDPSLSYPDLQSAGNSKAKARNYMQNHQRNLIVYSDPTDLDLNGRTIFFNQMTSQFSFNSMKISNYIIQAGARAHYRAGNTLELKSGTVIHHGADVRLEVKPCAYTVGFRQKNKQAHTALNIDGGTDKLGDNSIFVYPNPTEDNFRIKLEFDQESNYELLIYDALGKQIISKKGSAIKLDKTISLGNELNGLYLLKIKTADKLYQQKILKN